MGKHLIHEQRDASHFRSWNWGSTAGQDGLIEGFEQIFHPGEVVNVAACESPEIPGQVAATLYEVH